MQHGSTGPPPPAPTTDCDLLGIQLEALYHHDARGRITTRREPGDPAAPRFHLGRTRHGNLWRLRADLPSEVARRLARLAARESLLPDTPPPWPPAEREEAFRLALDEHTHEIAPAPARWAGIVHRLPDDAAVWRHIEAQATGSTRLDPDDPAVRDRLRERFPAHADTLAARRPVFASLDGGGIAALCYTAAGDPQTGCEAGVDTLPALRRRGHATRAVAGWLRAIYDAGGTPLYTARRDDEASRGVARRLGLVPFADVFRV